MAKYIYIYIVDLVVILVFLKESVRKKYMPLSKPEINIVSKRKNKKFLELGPCVRQVMHVHILKMGETIVLLQVIIRKRPTRYVKSIPFQVFN